jgi:hypothetical protein
MNFDLTMNMHDYLKFFGQLEAMDFDVIVPGHHSTPATREDLEIAKSYVTDVYNTITHILAEDHQALKTRAIQKYGENSWAVASVLINSEIISVPSRSRTAGQTAWKAWISGPPVTATRLCSMPSGMWGRGRENNMSLQGFRGGDGANSISETSGMKEFAA